MCGLQCGSFLYTSQLYQHSSYICKEHHSNIVLKTNVALDKCTWLYLWPSIVSVLSHISCSVLWEPMGDGKRVISLAENHVLLWDLQESSTKATVRFIIFIIAIFHCFSLSTGATSTAYRRYKAPRSVS